MAVDRLASDYPDAIFDGTSGADQIGLGSLDAEGDDVTSGDDVIQANGGDDKLFTSDGDDTIEAGDGSFDLTLVGQTADIVTDISSMAFLPDENGNGELVIGCADSDSLMGGAGDGSITDGSSTATFTGVEEFSLSDQGDSFDGGTGDDSLTGGLGDDTFTYSGGMDTITDFNTGNTGNTGTLDDGDNTNNDFIDLSAYYDNLSELHADYADDQELNQSNTEDQDGNAVSYDNNTRFGTDEGIRFDNASTPYGSPDGTFFRFENTGVICFGAGTLIDTPFGPKPVQDLAIGDLVITRDNGVQPILWIGTRHLDHRALTHAPNLRPVLLKRGVLGLEENLIVSPQHGPLLQLADRGGDEVLVRAKHLAELDGGAVRVMRGARAVTYVHLLFGDHQVIRANGAWSESLYPGHMALNTVPQEAMRELEMLFPGISENPIEAYGAKARAFSKRSALPGRLAALPA